MDDEFDRELENMYNDSGDELDAAMSRRAIQSMLLYCAFFTIVLIVIIYFSVPDFDPPTYITKDDDEINITEYTNEKNNSLIGINSATYDDLLNISGIGPTNANKILEFREKNGTIVSFDDLLEIDGIGKKKLEQIKESCYID